MELRKHPRMTYLGRPNWPPEWNGPYGPDNPLPRGEVGILVRVEPSSNTAESPYCFLVMQWNQQEYVGSLYFDDGNFLREFVELLRGCRGRSIAEIGSVDVP
jgi:hypothetical protein